VTSIPFLDLLQDLSPSCQVLLVRCWLRWLRQKKTYAACEGQMATRSQVCRPVDLNRYAVMSTPTMPGYSFSNHVLYGHFADSQKFAIRTGAAPREEPWPC